MVGYLVISPDGWKLAETCVLAVTLPRHPAVARLPPRSASCLESCSVPGVWQEGELGFRLPATAEILLNEKIPNKCDYRS